MDSFRTVFMAQTIIEGQSQALWDDIKSVVMQDHNPETYKGTQGGVVYYFSDAKQASSFASDVETMLDRNAESVTWDVKYTSGKEHVTVLINDE